MSTTDGPSGNDLPPPVGPPVAVPWAPPTDGPVLPAWGAPARPVAPDVATAPTAPATPIASRMPTTPAAWVPPAPVDRVPAYTAYLTGDRSVRYAGFWRRWFGAVVDHLVLTLINFPINLVIQLLAGAAIGTSGSLGLGLVILVFNLALNFYIWWRFIPGRIGRHGATLGMSSMNIRLVRSDGRSAASAGTAFVRALVSFGLQVVFLIPAVGYVALGVTGQGAGLSADDALREVLPGRFEATLFAFLLLLAYLPTLWQVVDRRYQTLYDKLSGVVVIRD